MAITTESQVLAALAVAPQRQINKISVASQIAGNYTSLWRVNSIPAAGNIPAAVAICNKSTLGAATYPDFATGDAYIAWGNATCSQAGNTIIIEDRLAHMGGLNGTLTTAQTVNVDASDSNLNSRRGSADYSELKWWLEWYTATGATIVTITCNVTYHDNTTGTIVVTTLASMAASRRLQIIPTNGKSIKSIQSVQQSATTGTSGSYGVTVSKEVATLTTNVSNKTEQFDWANIGMTRVYTDSCLSAVLFTNATSTGVAIANFKIIVG